MATVVWRAACAGFCAGAQSDKSPVLPNPQRAGSPNGSRYMKSGRPLATRVFIVIVALAVIAVLARGVFQQQRSAGYREGRTAAAGYTRASLGDEAAADDAQLSDDEAAAGGMWARTHGLDRASECPDYSAAFRRGCAGYVSGQGD